MRSVFITIAVLLQVFVASFRNHVPSNPAGCIYRVALSTVINLRACNSDAASTSSVPSTINSQIQRTVNKSFLSAALLLATTVLSSKPVMAASDREEVTYVDNENGFSVLRLPGWSIMPKQPPTVSLQKFQPEDVLFVASSFLEGEFCSFTMLHIQLLFCSITGFFPPDNIKARATSMLLCCQDKISISKNEHILHDIQNHSDGNSIVLC